MTGPPTLLQLMWAPSTKVGRRGITVGSIVSAAIDLADHGGLGHLSMRTLARSVGVGAMTLYGYVPGRAELVELMLDQVNSETYQAHPEPSEVTRRDGWQAGATQVAVRTFEEAITHPWITEVPPGRPLLGPGTCLRYERELAPLNGIGLDDVAMDHVRTCLEGLAHAAARWQIGLDRARSESGLDDQQWWEAEQPELAQEIGRLELPISSRVGQSVASAGDPRASLQTGVELLLAGVAARLG